MVAGIVIATSATMMNQTNALHRPVVRRRRVTPNEILAAVLAIEVVDVVTNDARTILGKF